MTSSRLTALAITPFWTSMTSSAVFVRSASVVIKPSLVDAAVLVARDLLGLRGVDVDDREDHHERLVLPHRDKERLIGDRDQQGDRVLGQARCSSLGHAGSGAGADRRFAEAEDRLCGVALFGAGLVLELDDEVDDDRV